MLMTKAHSVILVHQTSLAIAIQILKTRLYKPRQCDPLGGDSGMNVFEKGKKYNKNQEYAATGAYIIFEWTGPVEETNDLPFKKDYLIRQGSWRSIVPFGTSQHLRMTGIKASSTEWERFCHPAPWWFLIPSVKAAWLRRRAAAERASLCKILAGKPAIGVGVEPSAKYRT